MFENGEAGGLFGLDASMYLYCLIALGAMEQQNSINLSAFCFILDAYIHAPYVFQRVYSL